MVEKKLIKFATVKGLVKKYGGGHRISKEAVEKLQDWLEKIAESVLVKAAKVERLTLFPADIEEAANSVLFEKSTKGATTVSGSETEAKA